jgi:uncharacterized protein YmfQ (DUF2313 family)
MSDWQNWQPKDEAALLHAQLACLPQGAIWQRDFGNPMVQLFQGIAAFVASFLARCAQFLQIESYPPTSGALLPDWERVLGLPEPCYPPAQTIAERRAAVLEKLQRRPGGQSRQYFIDLAARLGYTITITEYRPFMAGVSRCADARWAIEPIRTRFYWKVNIPGPRLTWFRCGGGGGRAGTDPHLRIHRADDLECVFKKLQPAHGQVLFSYTGI